jgi:hypothetical protein
MLRRLVNVPLGLQYRSSTATRRPPACFPSRAPIDEPQFLRRKGRNARNARASRAHQHAQEDARRAADTLFGGKARRL